MSRRLKPLFSALFVIVLCSVLGGIFGPGLTGVSAASNGPEEDLKAGIKQFTKVYEAVENNFADKVSADKAIYKGSIPGMLRTLDPHSNFFDPKDFQALRDDQQGHYYGVGMTVGPRNGKTIVVAPHRVWGPETNDLVLQLRKRRISKIILGGMLANMCVESHLRELLEQGFEVAVAKDATAAPKHPEWGYGYTAALINYAYLAHAVWTTAEAVKAMEHGS